MAITKVRTVVLPGGSPFETAVAVEVFGIDRRDTGGPTFDFGLVTPDPGVVPMSTGFDIVVKQGLVDADDADVVVMTPFGSDRPVPESVLATLRAAHARGAWVVSLCSGVFALARAGLLDGRRATTHWMHADRLAREHPAVEVDPDVLYVQDGTIISSAGTAAAIDACLHLVRLELGAEAAVHIARRMVVPPHRDGGQAQYVAVPLAACSSDSMAPLLDWATENPREDLSVEALAGRALTSPRTFARRFRAETGTTPAAWVSRMRIGHAQRLLESNDMSVEEVAHASGFSDAGALRQHFARVLGTSPRSYRQRFRAA